MEKNKSTESTTNSKEKEEINTEASANRRKIIFTRNCGFYITNLDSYSEKDKVKNEFEKYGRIIELCVKRSSYTSYYLAYVKLDFIDKPAEDIIAYLGRKHNWKVSRYYKEEKEKEKRHICGKKDKIARTSRSISFRRNRNRSPSYSSAEEEGNSNVREIWVGNLPFSIQEQDLWNSFFIFGEIEKIELYAERHFAFIRYYLCASAQRASEVMNGASIKGCCSLKIKTSDKRIRRDIIGDKPGYNLTENNCTIIHVSLSANCQIGSEDSIKELFSKYGKVKGWSLNKDPPSVHIQYENPEDARSAIKSLMNLDQKGEKRKLIGDPLCKVNYYYKEVKQEGNENKDMNYSGINQLHSNIPSMSPPNLMPYLLIPDMDSGSIKHLDQNNLPVNNISGGMTHSLPSAYNPLSLLSNPLSLLNSIVNFQSGMNTGSNNPTANSLIDSLALVKLLQLLSASQNANQTGLNSLLSNTDGNIAPLILNLYNFQNNPNKNLQVPSLYPNSLFNPYTDIANNSNSNVHTSSNFNPIQLQENIANLQENTMPKHSNTSLSVDSEYSLEKENLKVIWRGSLSKNNKEKMAAVAYYLRGESKELLKDDLSLNIEHRTNYEDVLRRHHKGMIVFSPENESQFKLFDEYINYFNIRQRAAIVFLNNGDIVYIMAPCEVSRKFYQNPKKHLLGLIVEKVTENTGDTTRQVIIPPPIISNAEKKVILNSNNKDTTKRGNK